MARRNAYTLVEILMATVLGLAIMATVMQIFATVSKSITDSRAVVEINSQLRLTVNRLRDDLQGATATTALKQPPADWSKGQDQGYLEIIEGPIGPVGEASTVAWDNDNNLADSTVRDFDDILMLTVKGRYDEDPFIGRIGYKRAPLAGETATLSDGNGPYVIDSKTVPAPDNQAEVAYFVRGHTLYRRVLILCPTYSAPIVDLDTRTAVWEKPDQLGLAWASGFYNHTDVSVRLQITASGKVVVPNNLSDLTKREWRYAHGVDIQAVASDPPGTTDFPFDVRRWGQLGLPTIREGSFGNPSNANGWFAGGMKPATTGLAVTPQSRIDVWNYPYPWPEVNSANGALTNYQGPRFSEDIVLNNVIGFDIKVWDPYAPIVLDSTGKTHMPGDAGYISALKLVGAGTTIVSFGAFVDLNYMCRLGPEANPTGADPREPWPLYNDYLKANTNTEASYFYGAGDRRSWLRGAEPNATPSAVAAVYDTGSNHYENDGINQSDWVVVANPSPPPATTPVVKADEGMDGVDDNGDTQGTVAGEFDAKEAETRPPYDSPLQAIQIKVRVYEPDTKQIREVTVTHEFSQ